MPMTVSRTTGGVAKPSPIIGDYQTLGVKVDVSAMTNTLVDSDGYLKPGAPLSLEGLPLADEAGVAQVETATVAGTIGGSGAGNATVIVTSAAMSASPKTISVAVANNDTAAQVAGKIRTALANDGDVNDFFDVSGSTTSVILTRNTPAANDSTLNISVDNGTCTGLTAAPTSANTTAGVAAASATNAVPCIVVEATKIADNNSTDLATAADVFVACAVNGVLNRDVMEDNLGRVLNSAEIAALVGSNSRFTLSLT